MQNVSETKSQKAIRLAARKLFWKHGIRKVSVEEICKAANVSKMTFYRNFENKTEIAERVLNFYVRDELISYRSIMHSDFPFNQRIAQLIEHKRKLSKSVSEEFLHDILNAEDDQLRNLIVKLKEETSKEFYDDMLKAQKDGWIRPEIKIEFFVYMIDMIQREMENEHFLSLFDDLEDANMEISNLLFHGVISSNKVN